MAHPGLLGGMASPCAARSAALAGKQLREAPASPRPNLRSTRQSSRVQPGGGGLEGLYLLYLLYLLNSPYLPYHTYYTYYPRPTRRRCGGPARRRVRTRAARLAPAVRRGARCRPFGIREGAVAAGESGTKLPEYDTTFYTTTPEALSQPVERCASPQCGHRPVPPPALLVAWGHPYYYTIVLYW